MGDLQYKKLNCLRYARKMLSSRKCAPIDDFIKAGILPLVIDFISTKYDTKYDNYMLSNVICNVFYNKNFPQN